MVNFKGVFVQKQNVNSWRREPPPPSQGPCVKPAHVRWDGVVLQKGVWVRGVQQRAELSPSAPSKRAAELLGQFLWRVGQRQLVLHRTAPQLHPQLKLGQCVFTAAQQHNPGFSKAVQPSARGCCLHVTYPRPATFIKNQTRTRWRCPRSRCR